VQQDMQLLRVHPLPSLLALAALVVQVVLKV
jgi:hypothetical protein